MNVILISFKKSHSPFFFQLIFKNLPQGLYSELDILSTSGSLSVGAACENT